MKRRLGILCAVGAALFGLAYAYNFHPPFWKTAHMTAPSPKLSAVLSTVKPHCFGRFLIDLPEGAQTAWGNTLGFEIARGRAGELAAVVKAKEDERKSKRRYPRTENLNLYFETRNGSIPTMKHVVSQEDFGSEGLLFIDTYYALGDALIATRSNAFNDSISETIAEVEDIARRLRLRNEDEIPTDPGLCIDHAFVADRPDAAHEKVADFIDVGFRLADPADVHLSISIAAATTELARPGLEQRLRDAEHDAMLHGDLNLFGSLDELRRAHREVPAWKDGFEFLHKTRAGDGLNAYHDFWMIFRGQPDTLLRPYVDIRMQSGVADDTAGKVKTALTDADSLALWDTLVGTIRVRPTSATKAEAAPEVPLGTLAATGTACPRTGLWRCAEEGLPVQGGRERRFRVGETLPSAVLRGEPSVWQRVKGEAPAHATKTVWKLVNVDASPD